jgi:hypothetical protein
MTLAHISKESNGPTPLWNHTHFGCVWYMRRLIPQGRMIELTAGSLTGSPMEGDGRGKSF